MLDRSIDILIITYNRPDYTRRALEQLLRTCDEQMRVWIWHNGNHQPTLDIALELSRHPRVHRFHHSIENRKLTEPTNWVWKESTGTYVCKVDDDCLMPAGWADTLRAAHEANPTFGVIGCWRFPEEDFVPRLANKKIKSFAGGHRIMLNCWVEGSGYLMKRACITSQGMLSPDESFTQYCKRLATTGWTLGWYYPFLYQEHMDDPRSPHTLLKKDSDLERYAPLMAQRWGVKSVAQFTEMLIEEARELQSAPADPRYYGGGWRSKLLRARKRLRNLLHGRAKFKPAG